MLRADRPEPSPPPEPAPPRALAPADVLALLPHRPPALLIESVPWVEADRAVAVTRPLGLEPCGVPRPSDGTIAEPLIIEAVAQAAAAVAAHAEARMGALAAIPEFRFHARAGAGERLTIEVALERRLGRLITARGEVFAGAVRIAEGRVSLMGL
jgi:3-hydroxymyristoyl/3-hydroxydecanoyl-(acyl carrier protein) dehydratase